MSGALIAISPSYSWDAATKQVEHSETQSRLAWDIETKIKVYEDQVRGWIIRPARELLANSRHNGMAVIAICFTYVEGAQRFVDGRTDRGDPSSIAEAGIKRLFGLHGAKMASFAATVYSKARCGLFHNLFPDGEVIISHEEKEGLVRLDDGTVVIDPERFVDRIEDDLTKFVRSLAHDKHARNRFNDHWMKAEPRSAPAQFEGQSAVTSSVHTVPER